MNKNKSSINKIPGNQEPVNRDNFPVCPECIGINGSVKRNWMENHRAFIESTYEVMGMEYTCRYFKCKVDTLVSFLNRGEMKNRKSVTQNEITRNRVIVLDEKVTSYLQELERQAHDLDAQINRQYQLADITIRYHEIQAHLNTMMAELVKSATLNFTEHIFTSDTHKVSPTPENLTLNSTKSIKAGPTSSREVDRFSVSRKRETGKLHTSRSGNTRSTLRERYENRKRRFRRV